MHCIHEFLYMTWDAIPEQSLLVEIKAEAKTRLYINR